MKMKNVRFSRQREMILNNVLNRCDHPTAEMVYSSLKSDAPELSLGTVYRNLNLLSEQNKINRLDIGDGMIHFDGNTNLHSHFYCKECLKIYDLEIDSSITHQLIQLPHKVEGISIILNGICKECQQN